MTLDNFRYVGTQELAYNGFSAEMPANADGNLRVQANFDDGQSHAYRLVIERVGGPILVDESGVDQSVDTEVAVTGGSTNGVSFRSTEEVSGAGFVHAVISWP
jgi:hypothetical protein